MVIGNLAAGEADLAVSGSLRHGDLAPFRLNASANHAEAHFRCGRWDESQQTIEHVLDLADDMGQVWLTGFFHAVASLVPSARGDWPRAQGHIRAAENVSKHLQVLANDVFAAEAAVLLASHRGDHEGVLAAAEPLRTFAVTGPAHQPGLFTWPIHLILALVELGRIDEAEVELETLEVLARDQDNRPGLFSAGWLTGVVAAARRESGRARAAFEQALEMGDDHVQLVEQILARYHYGRFLRRRGERRRAVEMLQDGMARGVRVGAVPLVRRCEEELAACGVREVGPVAPAVRTLTPQEQVIAALVSQGHTNRQIAEKLVLSPKTVGYHLANVYAKLGVHSRLQLAHALTQQP
jgi:DNA-binding CsgD family transcriptional regulator